MKTLFIKAEKKNVSWALWVSSQISSQEHFFLNWLSIIKYKIVEKKTEMKLIVSWMVAT